MNPLDLFEARRALLISLHTAGGWDLVARWTMEREARTAVPRDPTEAMLNAAYDWSYKKYGKPIGSDAASGCWAAMLAAALPEPPKEPT
jgi:hypothetical protein